MIAFKHQLLMLSWSKLTFALQDLLVSSGQRLTTMQTVAKSQFLLNMTCQQMVLPWKRALLPAITKMPTQSTWRGVQQKASASATATLALWFTPRQNVLFVS
jgi:hypothetical protein